MSTRHKVWWVITGTSISTAILAVPFGLAHGEGWAGVLKQIVGAEVISFAFVGIVWWFLTVPPIEERF